MSRLCAVLVALLTVAGCGSADVTYTTEKVEPLDSSSATTIEPEPTTVTSASPATSLSTLPPSATSTTGSSTSTTQVPPAERGVVLRADGLGTVGFGETLEEVLDILEVALGRPTLLEDVEPDSPSMTEIHAYWEDAGLHTGFSTYPFYRSDGELHFIWWHTWATTPPINPLKTAEGVGWGSTMSDLANAYGDRFWVNSDECAPPGTIGTVAPQGDVPGSSTDEDGHPRWILVGFDQPGEWTDDGSRYIGNPASIRVAGMEAGISDGC